MLKTMIGAAIVGTLFMIVPASADRDHRDDHASALDRISTEAMTKKINELGYDVRRLEAEGAHFEAHIVERKSGSEVKALFDRKDGALIRAETHR